MKWKRQTIKEAPVEIIDGDRGKNYPNQTELMPEGYCLFLSAKNVTDEGFAFQECQFISQSKDEALRKGKLQRHDIVLTTRGTVGNIAYYSEAIPFDNVRINSGMVVFRTDSKELLPLYLYLLFRSSAMQNQIIQFRSGVAQPQLPIKDLREMSIECPSIEVQKGIVNILSTYDDLIENNRRRIALLEESARLLYQEWFVQMRFPGCEHTRIVDGVPEGWKKATLREICQEVRETVEPQKLEPDVPYIGLEHMPRRSISLSEWGVGEDVQSLKTRFKTGDVLFGKIRPYFHKVGVAFTDGVCSTDAIVIRPLNEDHYSLMVMVLSSADFVAHAMQSSTGSKMPRANWSALLKYPILIPSRSINANFSEFVLNIIDQLRTLSCQNRKLSQARDLLLPKLMSGEVMV